MEGCNDCAHPPQEECDLSVCNNWRVTSLLDVGGGRSSQRYAVPTSNCGRRRQIPSVGSGKEGGVRT